MRTLPDPGFADDDGAADSALVEALAGYTDDPEGRHLDTLAVLQHTRVIVPVVAVLGEVEVDEAGLARDKTSDMAAVLMRGRDGRTALLGFSGAESLARWDREARPVPVSARDAARAARQDGAEALVLDVAGPVMFVVEGDDLAALADGWRLVSVSGARAWVRPDR